MSMMKAYIADFRKDYKKKLRWFLVLNVALLFSAAGISLFKTPNHFAIGGTSGLAILLAKIFPWLNVSGAMALVNLLLLVLGFVFLGRGFGGATAARYLQAGRMPATLARVRQVYAERAQAMGDALRQELGDAISFVPPQGGLFVWARLTGAGGKVADGNVLAQRALEKGVAFVPGTPFFCAEPDHATLRLSFATADVDKIREGVARLAQAVQA